MTPQRRDVLGLILTATTPVGAYDLLEQLKTSGRKPAPLPFTARSIFCSNMVLFTALNACLPLCRAPTSNMTIPTTTLMDRRKPACIARSS